MKVKFNFFLIKDETNFLELLYGFCFFFERYILASLSLQIYIVSVIKRILYFLTFFQWH